MSELREGYNPFFLDDEIEVPLPTVGLEQDDDVLRREGLRDGHIADYVHYSIVMSKSNRQAFFSAANLDQGALKRVRGRRWFVDSCLGAENQVGPEAYSRNVWDRGHLTRRTAVTWGDSSYVAKRASNDSCSYANASFQHENFNQDEWRVPEEVVHHFAKDRDDRICVFTGPIFTEIDRWYTRASDDLPVRIPSGFWKMIAYIGSDSNELECQSYVMYQDDLFMRDKRGRHSIQPRNYQVTVTEIERLTGLEFPETLYERNQLFFNPREGINEGPEAFEAPRSTSPEDLATGVVFRRVDIEKPEFAERRRTLSAEEFEIAVTGTRDDLSERAPPVRGAEA